jgi:hypothetical protein
MFLTGAYRAPLTLLMAAGAGALLWLAATQVDRHTTGGYWAAYGLVALAGVVLGLAQLRGAGGHPPALLGAFIPILIAAGWVLLAMQPHANWFARHVRHWSSSIGIHGVVFTLGTWLGVLAFGIGLTLAAVFEPYGARRRVATGPGPREVDPAAADEPMAAERARERDATLVR